MRLRYFTPLRRGFPTKLGVLVFFLALALLPAGRTEAQTPILLTDSLGRELAFEEPPERIVIAGPATLMIADALYLFESGPERLVGVTRIDQGKGNFLRSIDPDYGSKTILERQVGPEQIAALRPDVVLLKTQVRPRLGVRLEALGIPVVYFDFETPGQYQRDIATLGRLLGERSRAGEVGRYLERKRGEILRRTTSVPVTQRPSVLFLYVDARGTERAFNVPPESWIQTTLVRDAGGIPVWTAMPLGGGWSTVTMEQIAVWDPPVVFLVAYRQELSGIQEQLAADSVWRQLTASAVGNTLMVPVDYYSWDQPDIRWILGLRWMAGALYPDLFPMNELRQDIYEFYSFLYGLSTEETDRIIFSVLEGDLLPEQDR